MAHYLLTGVAGFIASQVAEVLLAAGHTVVGLDNLNDAYDVRLKEWRLRRLVGRPGFEFQAADICDRPALEQAWAAGGGAYAAVINLAARAGVRYSVENPWVYLETNTTGTLNLLELCRRAGVPKFVLASTSSLYGSHNPQPYREDADTNRPLSPYAASKKAAEVLCHAYHHLYQLDVSVVRYFTVYGPAGRPDMSLFRFVQWISEGRPVIIFGDGRQSRDFTYVEDIARGTVAALKPLGYEILNLGSDRPAPLMDLLRLIEARVGRTAQIEYRPAHPADVRATWADISKARALLNWEPAFTYERGVEALVAWYQQERAWASQLRTE
ncbi:MAG: GDP-mannose 4,6-dehydratase [Anaerolineales bacterium]|nr:GDP-mannose 4,6-dehydratase [Anaerolineales bacterium]